MHKIKCKCHQKQARKCISFLIGFEWTKESSSSETFQKSASDSTTTTGTITVQSGQISSICQPVGEIDDYVIRASHFQRVPGSDCSNAK